MIQKRHRIRLSPIVDKEAKTKPVAKVNDFVHPRPQTTVGKQRSRPRIAEERCKAIAPGGPSNMFPPLAT